MNTNFFESKNFSIVLGVLLFILLIISGFFVLGDEKETTTVDDSVSMTDTSKPKTFNPKKDDTDEGYGDAISQEYAEYKKDEPDSTNVSPKDETEEQSSSTTSDSSSPKKSDGSSTPSGVTKPTTSKPSAPSKSPSTSSPAEKSPSSDGGKGSTAVVLPPVNVGAKNPTVPKLPNKPAPAPDKGDKDDNPSPTPPSDGTEDGTDEPKDDTSTPKPPPSGGDGGTPPVMGKPQDDLSSINPVNNLPPIDLGVHSPLSDIQLSAKTGLSMTGTTYWGDLRIKPVAVSRSSYGLEVSLEVGNLSDSPLSITEENLSFEYEVPYEPGSGLPEGYMAPSSVEGSPRVIQPDSKGVVVVSTPYAEAVFLKVELLGLSHSFMISSSDTRITDVKPLSGDDVIEMDGAKILEVLHAKHLVGSTNFKLEPLGIVLSGNDTLGPLTKAPNGTLGVVKVRFANTSSKEITLEKIQVISAEYNDDPSKDKRHVVDYPLSKLSLIGSNAFPTKIPARTIVEGYLPFINDDASHSSLVYVQTSAEDFYLSSVESYSSFALLQ